MKKITSIVLAVLVVFSMFTFIATAADAVTVTVKADKTAVKVGDVITVDVSVSENSKLCAFTGDLKYDKTVLEVVEGSAKVYGVAPNEYINPAYGSSTVRYTCASTSHIGDAAATMFTVQFKAIKDGTANISLSIDEAYAATGESSEEAVDVNTNTVKVTVEADEQPTEQPTEPEQPTEHVHSYSDWKVVTKATCEKDGEKIKTCKVCGDSVKEAIPATGHTEGKDWIVTKAATTTSTGTAVKKCTVCGEVLKTDTLPKLESAADSTVPSDTTIPGTDAY